MEYGSHFIDQVTNHTNVWGKKKKKRKEKSSLYLMLLANKLVTKSFLVYWWLQLFCQNLLILKHFENSLFIPFFFLYKIEILFWHNLNVYVRGAPFLKLEPWLLSPIPYNHLYLWSDHHIHQWCTVVIHTKFDYSKCDTLYKL